MTDETRKMTLDPALLCARCRLRPMKHPFLGCLCDECETEIDGMTQTELDADYEARTKAAEETP